MKPSRRLILPTFLSLTLFCFHLASASAADPSGGHTNKLQQESFFRAFLNAAGITPSNTKSRGPPHGLTAPLSDQSAYVSLGYTGAAVAVGDFNRDRLPDLVMLNTDTYKSVSVQFWDREKYVFVHRGMGATVEGTSLTKIVSVFTADFNDDGIVDILLADDMQGVVRFGMGNGDFNLTSTPLYIPEIPPNAAVVDADADFAPNLFVAFSNGTRGFWNFNATQPDNVTVDFKVWNPESHSAASVPGTRRKICPVVAGPSIASTDINGDCQAEFLVPTACGIEVWKAPTKERPLWSMDSSKDMRLLGPSVFNSAHHDGVIVYEDFNGDGTIDIGVANMRREDFTVHINLQKAAVEGNLCAADDMWRLQKMGGVRDFRVGIQRIGRLWRGHDLPPVIHVGDLDADGMPDMLIVDSRTGAPALFRNTGRWRKERAHRSNERNTDHFKRMSPAEEKVLGGGDAILAAFFDTDAGGRQDILIVRRDNDTRLIWNQHHKDSDALFFRGVALSTLPTRYRNNMNSINEENSNIYVRPPYAPIAGGTFKVSYASRLTSRRVTRVCSQCSQSGGHYELKACSCVLLLAHIANYIEEMALGTGGGNVRTWNNLMPNSMAIVWADRLDKRNWKIEYFTQRRGGPMFSVVAVLAGTLAILAALILYLQDKEKQQDIDDTAAERARLFHFGGL